MFKPFSDKEEFLAKNVADIAINIHKEMGPDYWKVCVPGGYITSWLNVKSDLKNKNKFR